MTQLNSTTFPAGPDPLWGSMMPPGLPSSTFVTTPALYTIEAEGVKVSAPYEADALRLFKRVRSAGRKRRQRAQKQEVEQQLNGGATSP